MKIWRLTIYPLRCAMHGAAQFWTKRWGFVCFKPPTYAFGKWWPAYLYTSPNATPWASTFRLGGSSLDRRSAAMRRLLWGHNFDTEAHWWAAQLVPSVGNCLGGVTERRQTLLRSVQANYNEPTIERAPATPAPVRAEERR